MKKLLLTFIIFGSPAFAFEDYMMISKLPVKSVTVNNPRIVDVTPLYTIDNQKKILIINPKEIGKTKVKVNQYGQEKTVTIKVEELKTEIKHKDGDFHCFVIDNPPHKYEILPPPEGIR